MTPDASKEEVEGLSLVRDVAVPEAVMSDSSVDDIPLGSRLRGKKVANIHKLRGGGQIQIKKEMLISPCGHGNLGRMKVLKAEKWNRLV